MKSKDPKMPVPWPGQILDILIKWTEPDDPCIDEAISKIFRKAYLKNAAFEILRSTNPSAKLEKQMTITPFRAGALTAQKRATSMELGRKVRPSKFLVGKKVPPGAAKFRREFQEAFEEFEAMAPEWRRACKVAARKAFAIALDQQPNESAQFFQGFLKGMKEGSIQPTGALAAAKSTTRICFLVLWFGEKLETSFKSSKAFHDWVTKAEGPNHAGTLDRFQKLCNRLQIKFKGPGRPAKKPRSRQRPSWSSALEQWSRS
jgi:hypothetical protein